ncbi:hypothetical protein [Actinoplanes sp. DH11]|uniref:hypothetical protein n=1 Tax=Actinoplanes sp. DH11 TaxID=2857011 RepID=UPI001E4A1BC6|nr:hypothetical protein [Actinoplanes sp. DH11]
MAVAGGVLSVLTTALINYATADAKWWLLAGPCAAASIFWGVKNSGADGSQASSDPGCGSSAEGNDESCPQGGRASPMRSRAGAILQQGFWAAVVLTLILSIPLAILPAIRASTTPEALRVRIDPASYEASSSEWSLAGPVYETGSELLKNGFANEYVHGAGAGSIRYEVRIDRVVGSTAGLSAYLSSDSRQHRKGSQQSDATVIINGHELNVQRVSPKDGEGELHEWRFAVEKLRVGVNVIEFRVEARSELHNGLCVYGKALVKAEPDKWVTLEMLG